MSISPTVARRVAITAQYLAGSGKKPDAEGLMVRIQERGNELPWRSDNYLPRAAATRREASPQLMDAAESAEEWRAS